MTKVHIWPHFKGEDKGDGGIRRVVEGQQRSLPAAGIEIVDVKDADVIATHAVLPDEYYLPQHARTPLVTHCHGLYWSEFEWERWALKANTDVMEAIRVADIVTAPTEWVAQAIRRHTMRDVRVVPHGVDLEEWLPWQDSGSTSCACPPDEREPMPGVKVQVHLVDCAAQLPQSGYVLWNKTRPDPVCDPESVNVVAARMPDVQFRTTFGTGTDNVDVTGCLPFSQAKIDVRRASVYLATTRETFGVGTLEALASGVPVVGWRWGGQAEFIEHGVDGWLAKPGDYDDLEAGVRWALDNQRKIVGACRAKAALFPWSQAGEMYAEIYNEVANSRYFRIGVGDNQDFRVGDVVGHGTVGRRRPKVTIIVTAYKLADYLERALTSVTNQTSKDWECIVVDDASPDACGKIADDYAALDDRFTVIHNAKNLHLSGARNVALAQARGEYILPLDADDQLSPPAVEVLSAALDKDKRIHIAYGNVRFIDPAGSPVTYANHEHEPGRSGWPVEFRIDWLWKGPGQLGPYSSMFRRSALERTGGYRRRYRSGEDQDVWLRTASYGFRPSMVTEEDCLIYTVRPDSMSAGGHENHRNWYPWTKDIRLAPAGAATDEQLPIHSCDPPLVSVIIPVGPGHEELLIDAVDSVDAQTYRRWECIVINDTGGALPALPSWVRVIAPPCPVGCETGVCRHADNCPKALFNGVAAARNAGIAESKGKFFLPLDADDMLEPRCIEIMVNAHKETGHIVYSDFWEDPTKRGSFSVYESPDWNPRRLTMQGALAAVTQLTPREVWEKVGGYNETVAWEDWAFQISYASLGYCAVRVPYPLWTYRKHTGKRRNENVSDFEASKQSIIDAFNGRFWDVDGVPAKEELMACKSCGGNGRVAAPVSFSQGDPPDGAVMFEYVGSVGGERRFRGASGSVYPFDRGVQRWVLNQDAPMFDARPEFRRVEQLSNTPSEVPAMPELTSIEHVADVADVADVTTEPEQGAPAVDMKVVATRRRAKAKPE